MMRWKLVLRIVAIVVLLMQFLRPDRTNPDVEPSLELRAATVVPADVSSLLESACYDCHSNETAWPWYAHVAPTSWFVVRHVDEGRRHLNFSLWGAYPRSRADHKLEEVIEYVENGEMPLSSYTRMHPEARISDADRQAIIAWAGALRAEIDFTGEEEEEETDEH
jgi:hypothetical protein